MKDLVLARRYGKPAVPADKITDQHLLPIYGLVVTGSRNSGDFFRLSANGRRFGLKHPSGRGELEITSVKAKPAPAADLAAAAGKGAVRV